MDPEVLLQCLQDLTTCSCPEIVEFWKSNFLFIPLRLVLLIGLFPSGLHNEILYAFALHSLLGRFPTYLVFLT